jgi:DNA-binding MarR family transcriptional regulator
VTHYDACKHHDGAPARLRGTAFWLLGRASLDAQRLTQERLAAAGMRRGFYGVLAVLAEFGPSAQADIGRRLGVDRSDMVAILNDLESERYVTRAPDPADRRRNSVVLTRAGRAALGRFDRAIGEAEKAVLSSLSVTERASLVGLLQRIVHNEMPSG